MGILQWVLLSNLRRFEAGGGEVWERTLLDAGKVGADPHLLAVGGRTGVILGNKRPLEEASGSPLPAGDRTGAVSGWQGWEAEPDYAWGAGELGPGL